MPRLALHWQILIALLLAVIAGGFSSPDTELLGLRVHAVYVFVGEFFMNALKMLIVPLIFSSIIAAMAQLNSGRDFGRLGLKTLAYYVSTSLLAILMGLFWVNALRPGAVAGDSPLRDMLTSSAPLAPQLQTRELTDLADVFLDMVPANIVRAAVEGQMLGIICFSLLFGYVIGRIKDPLRQQQIGFWEGINQVMIGITQLVLKLAPVGVFALVARTVSETGFAALLPMLWFFATVVLALLLHAVLSVGGILLLVARLPPWRAWRALAPVLLMAFSTASSSATLPVTLQTVQQRAGVSKRVSSFVLPLGATVNMDGTALYECVAAIFIAQLFGIELGFATQFSIVLIALLTSIGVAGIPAASLVAITIILAAVGLPAEAIGLLMVTDRLLDMLRTAVNVLGDACGSIVIARTEGEAGVLEAQARPEG